MRLRSWSTIVIGLFLAAGYLPLSATHAQAEPRYFLPWPAGLSYKVTQSPGSTFSHNDIFNRYAVDFGMGDGSLVTASAAGVVRLGSGWGTTVFVDHGGDACTLYGHLGEPIVVEGQKVAQGQPIAYSGHSGTDAAHLHWGKVSCKTHRSQPISTAETGSSFSFGTWPVSQNRPGIARALRGGLTSAANVDGRLEVYGVGLDGNVYRRFQTVAGGAFAEWAPIGGNLTTGATLATAKNPDGRIELYVVGKDGRAYTRRQPTANGDFGTWESWGGPHFRAGAPLATAINRDGRIEVYGVGRNGRAYKRYQKTPGGTFTAWSTWGGSYFPSGATLTSAVNADGRIEVYGVGRNGRAYKRYQAIAGGTFEDWFQWGGDLAVGSRLAAARNADGRLEIYAVGMDGYSYKRYQSVAGGTYVDWYQWGGRF